MSRSTRTARPRLRALATAALLASSALGGIVVAAPAATAAEVRPNLLVTTGNGNLIRVDAAGNAEILATGLGFALAVDQVGTNGDIFVAAGPTVWRLGPDGQDPVTFASGFNQAQGVAVDDAGSVYVADREADLLYRYSADGASREVVAGPQDFDGPANLSIAADGDLIVPLIDGSELVEVAPGGAITRIASGLSRPSAAAQAPDGSYIVGDQSGGVRRVSSQGTVSTIGTAYSLGVDTLPDGTVYSTDYFADRVVSYSSDGAGAEVVADGLGDVFGLTFADSRPPTTPQEITFTSTAPATAVVDGASYTPTATGGASGQPVTFSTTTPDTCTYSATTNAVSFVGAGDCTVAADQAGGTGTDGTQYTAAPTKSQTFTVGKGAQAITFAADTPTTGTVGESFTPEATGGASGNPVTFSVTGGACSQSDSVNADTVTFIRRGTCVVTADQAGDENYQDAPATQTSIAVDVAPTTLDLVVSDEGMTATVTGPDGGPAPTGDVAFNLDQGPSRQPLGTVTLTPVDGEPTLATATLPASADPGTSGQIEAVYSGADDDEGVGRVGGSEDTYTRTAPAITAAVTSSQPANEAGWYATRARVTFTCTAGTGALVGDCPAAVTRDNSVPGFTAVGAVTADDGGRSSVSQPLQVDTRGPVLYTRRVGSAPYSRTARPVRCTAVDGRSGVDGSCTVTYGRVVAGPNGGARRTWTATATDVAGNTTTRTNSFSVTGAAPRPTRDPSSPGR